MGERFRSASEGLVSGAQKAGTARGWRGHSANGCERGDGDKGSLMGPAGYARRKTPRMRNPSGQTHQQAHFNTEAVAEHLQYLYVDTKTADQDRSRHRRPAWGETPGVCGVVVPRQQHCLPVWLLSASTALGNGHSLVTHTALYPDQLHSDMSPFCLYCRMSQNV